MEACAPWCGCVPGGISVPGRRQSLSSPSLPLPALPQRPGKTFPSRQPRCPPGACSTNGPNAVRPQWHDLAPSDTSWQGLSTSPGGCARRPVGALSGAPQGRRRITVSGDKRFQGFKEFKGSKGFTGALPPPRCRPACAPLSGRTPEASRIPDRCAFWKLGSVFCSAVRRRWEHSVTTVRQKRERGGDGKWRSYVSFHLRPSLPANQAATRNVCDFQRVPGLAVEDWTV